MNYFINSLTYFRIFTAPFIFLFITYFDFYIWALILFILASISDYLDGFLARKYKLESVIGAILDPIADKILVTFLILALSIEFSSIFIGLAGGLIIVREFWVSALRDFNSKIGNKNATKVTLLAKTKTTIQLLTFISFLTGLVLGNELIIFISNFFLFLALIITIQTGLLYTASTFKR